MARLVTKSYTDLDDSLFAYYIAQILIRFCAHPITSLKIKEELSAQNIETNLQEITSTCNQMARRGEIAKRSWGGDAFMAGITEKGFEVYKEMPGHATDDLPV